MANIKISQLPQAPNVSTATTLAVVQSGTTYQATLAQVGTAIATPANAETLTGTFLASNVINSSLQTVGVMTGLSVSGGVQVNGNISANTNISVTGNATVGNILTAGLISATGNATVGNLLTAGLISATSTITSAANISGSNILTAGLISATGNVIGSNVNTAQVYNATGLTITNGSGNISLSPAGNVVVNSKYINNVLDPVQNQDVATKSYVDNLATTGIAYHQPVVAATTTTLATTTGGTVTYIQPNGVANGVGATLTTTGSFNLIDTANIQTVGTRILVKDEANAVFNGVYTWANATNIVRSLDTDEYGPDSVAQLSINDYFFTTGGNVNAGTAFVVSAPAGTITFGTSNIQFSTFSTSQVYSANTSAGISLNGTVFSAKVDNATTAFDGSGNISVKAGAVLTTPNVGVATATSINKVTITAPATSSTLTVADGKTFTASNTLTLTGTDATSFAFPGTSDTVATLAATQTLTNKRINPRTVSTASTATLTPDISAYDQLNLTAQAVSLTVAAPTGTPVDGNKLVIRILDNGTPQTITWNATYTVIGVTLPTTTTANKMVYIGCVYNSTNTRWDVVAVSTQA